MSSNVAPLKSNDIMQQAVTARGTGRSQATVVEQSRAIAEVQGALMVADRRPRDKQAALSEALESCRTQEVAQGAFFKFPRGGQSVSGPSIHLARELARCWGNIIYAVVELDRDEDRQISEMMAYAWDLETNTRNQNQFLVPHKRDKRGGAEVLTDMRDIYENNANMGSRRLRECIFAVLPPYLTKAAEEQCYKTLQEGGDNEPLPVRINKGIEAFVGLGIDRKRIEARMGPIARFTEVDYANLRIAFGSIQRGEVRADDEFPKIDGLTGEMVEASARPNPPQETSDGTLSEDNPAAAEGPADEQRGEAHVEAAAETETAHIAAETMRDIDGPIEEADAKPAWAAKEAEIRNGIAQAKTKTLLDATEREYVKHCIAFPQEVASDIEAAIAAKKKELAA